jgi:hypothetical protein
MGTTRVAIALFVAVAALGPIYTAQGYSPVVNVISELAAQKTPRNYFMSAAFVALGMAVVYDGAKAFHRSLLPFMLFGIAFAAAGVFGHKPISDAVPYSAWLDAAHSTLATASGIALTVGFLWQAAAARPTAYRLLSAALAIVCVALPLLMLNLPGYQGLSQRVMYLLVFAWLWVFYPRRADA